MRDLKVNIGGPRDQATQNIVFNIRHTGNSGSEIHKEEVARALERFRKELRQCDLPVENSKRVERNLTTIDEEAKSSAPSLKDIEGALGSIGRILETAERVAPAVVTMFRALAGTLGFSV